MATLLNLEYLHYQRWVAISEVAYNSEAAIYKYWKVHPELGSPIDGEVSLMADQSTPAHVGQAFANGILLWSPDGGVWQWKPE